MKCDELTPIELECNMGKDSVTGLVNREPWKAYDIDEVDEAIAELKAEINRKEAVGKRWFERCMEARAENVGLKRALWLARVELCHRLDVDRYLRKHRNSWYNEKCLTWAEACVAMEVKMCKAESKCRSKAEEYK